MRPLKWEVSPGSILSDVLHITQFQCSHMTCFVSIELVETSQMRSLTWVSTVKCSAYYLNKLSSSVLTRLFRSVQTQMRPLNEESHLDQYYHMFCILLEQIHFQFLT